MITSIITMLTTAFLLFVLIKLSKRNRLLEFRIKDLKEALKPTTLINRADTYSYRDLVVKQCITLDNMEAEMNYLDYKNEDEYIKSLIGDKELEKITQIVYNSIHIDKRYINDKYHPRAVLVLDMKLLQGEDVKRKYQNGIY